MATAAMDTLDHPLTIPIPVPPLVKEPPAGAVFPQHQQSLPRQTADVARKGSSGNKTAPRAFGNDVGNVPPAGKALAEAPRAGNKSKPQQPQPQPPQQQQQPAQQQRPGDATLSGVVPVPTLHHTVTPNHRNNLMVKEVAEFSPLVASMRACVLQWGADGASGLAALRAVLDARLPTPYDRPEGGDQFSAQPVAAAGGGGGGTPIGYAVETSQLVECGEEMRDALSQRVLAPLDGWLATARELAERNAWVHREGLALEERRRGAAEADAALEAAAAAAPDVDPELGDKPAASADVAAAAEAARRHELALVAAQTEADRLARQEQRFAVAEAEVFNSAVQLLRDAQVLREYAASSLYLMQRALASGLGAFDLEAPPPYELPPAAVAEPRLLSAAPVTVPMPEVLKSDLYTGRTRLCVHASDPVVAATGSVATARPSGGGGSSARGGGDGGKPPVRFGGSNVAVVSGGSESDDAVEVEQEGVDGSGAAGAVAGAGAGAAAAGEDDIEEPVPAEVPLDEVALKKSASQLPEKAASGALSEKMPDAVPDAAAASGMPGVDAEHSRAALGKEAPVDTAVLKKAVSDVSAAASEELRAEPTVPLDEMALKKASVSPPPGSGSGETDLPAVEEAPVEAEDDARAAAAAAAAAPVAAAGNDESAATVIAARAARERKAGAAARDEASTGRFVRYAVADGSGSGSSDDMAGDQDPAARMLVHEVNTSDEPSLPSDGDDGGNGGGEAVESQAGEGEAGGAPAMVHYAAHGGSSGGGGGPAEAPRVVRHEVIRGDEHADEIGGAASAHMPAAGGDDEGREAGEGREGVMAGEESPAQVAQAPSEMQTEAPTEAATQAEAQAPAEAEAQAPSETQAPAPTEVQAPAEAGSEASPPPPTLPKKKKGFAGRIKSKLVKIVS